MNSPTQPQKWPLNRFLVMYKKNIKYKEILKGHDTSLRSFQEIPLQTNLTKQHELFNTNRSV